MSPATIDLAIRAAADVSKAEAGLNGLGDTAGRMADDVSAASREADRAARSLDGIADSADGVATKGSILAGAMGDIGGGLEAAGLGGFGTALEALSTPLMFAAGLGDLLAVSMESLKLATLKETAANVANRAATIASTAAQKAQAAAQWALNAAMSANPIGLIIVAVVALVAGLVLLYKHSAKFRAIVQAVGRIGRKAIGWVVDRVRDLIGWVRDKAPAAFNVMKGIAVRAFNAIPIVFLIRHLGDVVSFAKDKLPSAWNAMKRAGKRAWDALTAPIRAVIGFVQNLIDKISNIHWPDPPDWVKSLGSAAGGVLSHILPRTAGRATPSTATGSPSAIASPGQIVNLNVTVNGAVDPMATAQQISSLLGNRARVLGIGSRP